MIMIKTIIGISIIVITVTVLYCIGRIVHHTMSPNRRTPDLVDIAIAAMLGTLGGIIVWIVLCVAYLIGEVVLRVIQ